jgi:hypothetical protein
MRKHDGGFWMLDTRLEVITVSKNRTEKWIA